MGNVSIGTEVEILRYGAKAGPLKKVKVSVITKVQVLSFLLPHQNMLETLLDYFILNEGGDMSSPFLVSSGKHL